MLLGQLSLLGLIIFGFLFIMSLFRKDRKTVPFFIITVAFSVVFFIIVTPESDNRKPEKITRKPAEPEEIPEEPEELDVNIIEDKTDDDDNTPIKLPEGPIPNPIPYEGNGDDVIEIKKPETGPIVLYVKGNQDSNRNHFTIHGYDDDDKLTDIFINIHDPYEGQTLDVSGRTSLLEIQASGAWEIEVRSVRSMEKINLPGKLTGEGDEVFILDDYVMSATIEGNKDTGPYAPQLKVIGYKPAVKADEFFYNSFLTTFDENYQGTVEVDDYIHILGVFAESPWSIEIE